MSRLSLFLPGLRRAAAVSPLPPLMCRVLARADWRPALRTFTQTLLSRLGHATTQALPIANLCACHDLDLPALDAGWYRADPIHLRADPRLILLLAPQTGEISPDEAAACLEALNAQLPEGVWRSGRVPERWYVRGPNLGAAAPYGPAWLNGRSITPFVSREPEDRAWRTLFNDAQMVLHAVEGNASRELAGRAPVNAVWPWGGGAELEPAEEVHVSTFGNDLLLAGASRANAVDWQANTTPAGLLERLASHDVALMLGSPWGQALPDLPVLDLETFSRDWLPVLWEALGQDALEEIDLIGESHQGCFRASARWKVWKSKSTFALGDPHAIDDGAVP